MVSSLALLSLALLGTPQNPATPTASILSATGAERVFEGREQSFSISRSGESILLRTTRNIGGALAGEDRVELRTPEGIYTYLAAQPAFALQLLLPSTDQMRMLDAPRFRLSDLRTNLPAVERLLGGRVTVGRSEVIAGRRCFPIQAYEARTKRQQIFWIDEETGITLRYVEMINGEKDYERWFTRFEPNATLPETTFQLSELTTVIRGVPDAGILRHAAKLRGQDAYREELNNIRAKSALGSGNWLQTLPEIPGFQYAHTVHRERTGSLTKEQLAQRVARSIYNNEIALRPYTDTSFALTAIPTTGRLFINTNTSFDSSNSMIVQGLAGEYKVAVQRVNSVRLVDPPVLADVLTSRAFQPDFGRITFLTGSADPATLKKLLQEERNAGADGIVQSDFLDPKTGDTVSFIQLRHRGIASLFSGLELPSPSILTSKTLGRVRVHILAKPFPLHLITYQTDEGSYVLASTRLTPKELLALAESAR